MEGDNRMAETRVLIVEDEMVVANDLQRKLQGIGYDVPDIASTGTEAIEKASRLCPDIVLMDIVLRGPMDGIEAADRIRQSCGIPVVFLTAHADEATFQRAKISEPFGYILKPFDLHLVNITIEIGIYKHRMERERTKLVAELQEALSHVRTLSGMLPICAWCKKIRDDAGYWQEVETYIHRHSNAEFSHGICPDCQERYHREFLERRKQKSAGDS